MHQEGDDCLRSQVLRLIPRSQAATSGLSIQRDLCTDDWQTPTVQPRIPLVPFACRRHTGKDYGESVVVVHDSARLVHVGTNANRLVTRGFQAVNESFLNQLATLFTPYPNVQVILVSSLGWAAKEFSKAPQSQSRRFGQPIQTHRRSG